MTTMNQHMTEKTDGARSVHQLVRWMTIAAWTTLLIGLGLSLWNIGHFSEQNVTLMVGIGFMVGSVHIYVIRTAIHLVHSHVPSVVQNNERA